MGRPNVGRQAKRGQSENGEWAPHATSLCMSRLLSDSVHWSRPMPTRGLNGSVAPIPRLLHPLQSCAYCISELVMLQVLTAQDFKLSWVIGPVSVAKPGTA